MLRIFFLLSIFLLATGLQAAPSVQVKGLIGGSAVLLIDGQQRLLKVGNTSPEGVSLIKADTKGALVEIDGERHFLTLSNRIGGSYKKTSAAEVRLASGHGGHYITPARINNRPVQVMLDTGATSVAMNMQTAQQLGINYRAGRKSSVSTANGTADSFDVMLDRVTVGNVQVHHVAATIIVGDSPSIILLGNSYLSRVNMWRDEGVMVLQSKL
jgi:aspartyl protease family protein